MADALTTTTQVDPAVATFYDRVLLETAKPRIVHERYAQSRPIPSNSGNTIKFRRYALLTPATTPLAEGENPPGEALSKTDLTATISFYGNYVKITDVVNLTVEDPTLTVAAQQLGQNMAQTRDQIVRDILAACASSTNASGGTNGNTPTELTRADIDSVVMTLINANAMFITDILKAGTGVGTTPVRAAFWGIMDSSLLDDLEDVAGFVPTSEYPTGDAQDGEWGNTGNVRWVQTTIGYSNGASPDVFSLPVIGKDAYGVTELSGASVSNIVKPFGSSGVADPLDRLASSGWKMAFVARILNDNFMHILKVTHS